MVPRKAPIHPACRGGGYLTSLYSGPVGGSPFAIRALDVHKSFWISDPGPRTLRSRLLHPVERGHNHELRVLDGVSFTVSRGEFFGIVGRNGSGKSTLLRILASIYRADAGTVEVSGLVAPMLELGVGFNPELSARENIVLNGAMLGLSPKDLRRRSDEILDFGEITEFADLPVKNFSSGMRMRLAFAVLVQADPEILLVDEVLAFGDVAFREKCADVFLDLHKAGKTIVLVTHDMYSVHQYCNRAMLLERGRIDAMGDTQEVLRRSYELMLAHGPLEVTGADAQGNDADFGRARITELRLRTRKDLPFTVIPAGEPLEVEVLAEVDQPLRVGGLRLAVRTEHEARVFVPPDPAPDPEARLFEPGETAHFTATIENRLTPGRYLLSCGVLHTDGTTCEAGSPTRTVAFEVGGPTHGGAGLVSLDHTVEVKADVRTQPSRT